MSDYIFNCFKEHVTTGLVCSLSADATDVLTEWKGRAPLCFNLTTLTHEHTVFWHMYTFTLKNG